MKSILEILCASAEFESIKIWESDEILLWELKDFLTYDVRPVED